MSEAKTHALLSPSGAVGWLSCVGKIAMERGMPDTPSEYSEEGDCAHAVSAMCLTEGRPASAYIGRRVDIGPCKTYEFREDMAPGVQCYVDAVLAAIERYKLAGATSVEIMVEQRVPIGHITGEEGAEGTADVVLIILWSDGTALIHVIDLKFGQGIKVEAEQNPQGMLYALGAVEKFSVVTDFSRAVISIHQPRVSEEPSEWEIGIKDLQDFGYTAGMRAREALDIYNGTMGSGPVGLRVGDHCKKSFCKARATCPAYAAGVVETVGAEFEVIAAIPDHEMKATIAAESDDRLAAKMAACDRLEDFAKAVRAEVERRLLASLEVPGYKLVQGRQGSRAWTSKEDVELLFKDTFRLKVEEMYDLSLISPTTAEKRVKEGTIGPKQWKKVEALITRPDGKISVAPVSDKRPAISVAPAADDFATVEEGADLV